MKKKVLNFLILALWFIFVFLSQVISLIIIKHYYVTHWIILPITLLFLFLSALITTWIIKIKNKN